MKRRLRWTEQAVEQLGAIADYISLSSPVYAEGVVERVAVRIESTVEYPDIGHRVPELDAPETRQLIECPTGSSIDAIQTRSRYWRLCTADAICSMSNWASLTSAPANTHRQQTSLSAKVSVDYG